MALSKLRKNLDNSIHLYYLLNDPELTQLYLRCKNILRGYGYLKASKVPLFLVSTDEVSSEDFAIEGFLYKGCYQLGDLSRNESVDKEFLELVDRIKEKYGSWNMIVFDQGKDWSGIELNDSIVVGPYIPEDYDLFRFSRQHIKIKACTEAGIATSMHNYCTSETYNKMIRTIKEYAAEPILDTRLNQLDGMFVRVQTISLNETGRVLSVIDRLDNEDKIKIIF